MSLPPSIESIMDTFNWTTDGGVVQLAQRIAAEAARLQQQLDVASVMVAPTSLPVGTPTRDQICEAIYKRIVVEPPHD